MKRRSRRGPRLGPGAAVLVLLLQGTLGPALAQPPPASSAMPPAASPPSATPPTASPPAAAPVSEEEAVRRFGEGRRLLEAGDYPGALVELRASLAALPSPNTELLVGHAQRLGGARGEAATTYKRVIASAGEKVRAGEDRFKATLEEAGRWEATLRSELAEVEIFVAGAAPGTSVAIDGAEVKTTAHPRGLTTRVMHEPGPIAVTARSPDGRTVSASANGTAGAGVAIDLDLSPPPPPPPPPADRGIGPPPLASWIAAGVGATGLVVFGVFGAMSAGAASDLEDCAPSCSSSLRETADGGARDQAIANVGLVVGAVGLVTAGVLWLTWPDDEPSAPRSADPPASAPAAIRWRVSPAGATDVTLRF